MRRLPGSDGPDALCGAPPAGPRRSRATRGTTARRDLPRAQLQEVLARYEAAAQSTAYSERLRAEARSNADSIRARLRDGDMRVGDRVRLTVDGQAQLTDTFAVSAGPALRAAGGRQRGPGGRAALRAGGPRSRRAWTACTGARRSGWSCSRGWWSSAGVARPGFYALPREALVDDAISAAGGLAPDGRLAEAYIERGRGRLWETDSLQIAMRERRTIGDLGLQAGDRIVVPIVAPSDPARTRSDSSPTCCRLPLSIYALIRLF